MNTVRRRPNMRAAALWYARGRLPVFPIHNPLPDGGCSCGDPKCDDIGKHPRTLHGFKDATSDREQVDRWWTQWPDANIGIPADERTRLLVIDSDPRNGAPKERSDLIELLGGPIPDTAEVLTGGGGRHIYLLYGGGPVPKGLAPGVDLKANGGYVVAPPSLHASGKRYTFDGLNRKLILTPAEAPDWLAKRIAAAASNGHSRAPIVVASDKWLRGERNNKLASLAGTMRRRGMSAEAIEAALIKENQLHSEPPLDDAEVKRIAKSVASYRPADPLSFPYTDLGNAELFVHRHGDRLRFCPAMKKFLVRDEMRWCIDDRLQAEDLAQSFIREKFREAVNADTRNAELERHWFRSQSDNRIRAMLHLVQPQLVVVPEQLDAHPDLLNFKNGTLNLRTGVLGPHKQEDFLTKLVHYNYNPEAQCPLWLRFLNRAMGGDKDQERARRLVAYLQTAFGYSLTGHTSDKAVFFAVGIGDTGKSTMLHTFRECIPEYGTVILAETLFNKFETSNTQADLADLRGARFAMTSEVDEGVRLREGKLKRITQGMGDIKAARKYENPITFAETHKLWIDANHKPEIKVGDDALWRRLHLIPFNVKVPKAEQDQELTTKLRSEAEGILAWAVQGARRWYLSRLQPPAEILAAVHDYRTEEDWVARFLADRCSLGKGLKARAATLYAAFAQWCKDNGENCPSSTAFGRRLTERGYTRRNDGRGIVYAGIGLKSADGEGPYAEGHNGPV